ncbi:hypothetical protein EVB39_045 [Rhizobium phage RHph_TM3_3_9]|nr:hypothetical protein EVB39_045 [Rhizobium phage RHph_TM3_3_9]QIG68566.1 hypothetical protein EVB66_045 [Rhizobium phage RHph_TM3_3_13]QIG74424.1 hypothetical protein EVC09_044 [Rhizobium phage RHph_TM3_3_10]QXV74538.1 hypothetical protein [Rhizobium phage RHEph19]
MTDLAPSIRAAILAESDITNYLSQWNGAPAVFTRRPVPEDAQFPMIVISPDIAHDDFDGLKARRDVITRDVIIYGRVAAAGSADDHTRRVDAIGYLLREIFHRQPHVLVNADFRVVSINVTGPLAAPTDSDSIVARVVTLIVRTEQI